MKLLQPVVWGKGIFLQPQHLQLQEGFLESLIGFQARELTFKPWGFARLESRILALSAAECVLQIGSACGLMPDGLPFDIAEGSPEGRRLSLALNPKTLGDLNEADVYLAIPAYRQGTVSIALDGPSATARYLAQLMEDVCDETSGADSKAIQLAANNFRLLFEWQTEELGACSSMRIARIKRTGDRAFRIDETSPPPLLRLQASRLLDGNCRSLLNFLTRKAKDLTVNRRPQGEEAQGEVSALSMTAFGLLHTLNASIPLLREYCPDEQNAGDSAPAVWLQPHVPGVHPVNVYRELMSLAGALNSFALGKAIIPAYDHDSPGRCFSDLIALIRRLVTEALPRTHEGRILKPRLEPNQFSVPLPDEWFGYETSWYLAVTSPLDDTSWKALVGVLERTAKVASVNDISALVRKTTPGVEFSWEEFPPNILPGARRRFRLVAEGSFWDGVRNTRSLAVYLPKEALAQKVEVEVILPEEQRSPSAKP